IRCHTSIFKNVVKVITKHSREFSRSAVNVDIMDLHKGATKKSNNRGINRRLLVFIAASYADNPWMVASYVITIRISLDNNPSIFVEPGERYRNIFTICTWPDEDVLISRIKRPIKKRKRFCNSFYWRFWAK